MNPPKCPRSKEGHRLVVEARVGGCVGHVRLEVQGRRIDLRVRGDVRNGRQEIIHDTRVQFVGIGGLVRWNKDQKSQGGMFSQTSIS